MKKKRLVLVLLCLFIFPIFFTISASAEHMEIDELLDEAAVDSVLGSLDEQTADLLSRLGLDEINIESLLDISAHKIIDLIFDIFKGKFSNLSKYALILLGVLILISLIDSFVSGASPLTAQFNSLYSIFFILAIASPLLGSISNVLSAIKLTTDFSLLLIPVFAGIITAAGKPTLALTYHSLTFSLSQIISQFTSKYLSAFMGVNLALSIAGSFNPLLKTQNITNSIKKIFTVILSLCASLFTGLLTIKGLIAGAADSLALKGGKFFVSTFIPVVGGSIGDGLASVLGSLSLLNSVLGVVGMVVIALINIPVIIEVLLWWFILNLCAFAAGMLGKDDIAELLRGLSSVVVMLNILLIFIVFVFIISIGLTLSLQKSG